MTDNINQPAHYTAGGIETIDVIEGVLGKYDHRDQVEKYNQRAHLKGNFRQDLEKARWYLNRTIENCEKGKLDPVTGSLVDTAEEKEEADKKFDTSTVHKDNEGDYWMFNDSTQEWKWYTLLDDLSSVDYYGGAFTAEDLERNFETHFIEPVEDEQTARKVREAVEEYDNPKPKIVLGETHPEDMPVGTVAYRDGERSAYSVRKEVDGWSLAHQHLITCTDDLVAHWFKFEDGWTLEKPSDVYKDEDGDYWVDSGDGWRWHNIKDGELTYRSVQPQRLEDVEETFNLEKQSDRVALHVRRIIKKGVK